MSPSFSLWSILFCRFEICEVVVVRILEYHADIALGQGPGLPPDSQSQGSGGQDGAELLGRGLKVGVGS